MESKKRILLTSPSALNNGGVQFVLMTIVRNLSKDYIFDILTFNSYQNYYNDEFQSFGGNIYCINKKEGKNIFYKVFFLVKLKKYLHNLFKKQNYYCVHCNSGFLDSIILKSAYKSKIDIRISHSHGTIRKSKFLKEIYKNYARKQISKYSTKKVGCSEMSCASFFKYDKDYFVINNPYDDSSIKTFNKTPEHLTILQIGSFFPNKNHIFTVETFNYIKKTQKNAILRFVGIGDANALIKRIKELNLVESVFFHKSDEEKRYLFENSTYLILPSFVEGFGIVLIEAQAGGMHCFASDTITKEVNLGGVHYFSLKEGPEECAKKILMFYKNNKGKKERFDCSNFTIGHFVSDIIKLYS